MLKGFKKVIEQIILPKYPEIVDYEINTFHDGGLTHIIVHYYFDGVVEVTEDLEKIENITRNMFKMIGFPKHIVFDESLFMDNVYNTKNK